MYLFGCTRSYCWLQDVQSLQHVESSSLTRDRTKAHCTGSVEFYLLDDQGSPINVNFRRLINSTFWIIYPLRFTMEIILQTEVQFSSVTQSCPALWDPMDCSTPGFPVFHHLPELAQTHVHWVSDAIQPSGPLSTPSPPAYTTFPSIRVLSNE